MQVEQDCQFADDIKQCIRGHLLKDKRDPQGIYHISEILAPRESFFRRKGHEYPLTDSMVGFFSTGIAFHEFLQKVLGEELAEKEVHFDGNLVGTIDMVGAFFSEIKTSRKWSVPKEPDEHYLEQFGTYLAAEDRESGHLIVIYFTAGRTWNGKTPSTLEIVSWKVTTTKEEREDIRAWALERRDMIENALAEDDHTTLPLCWYFKCGFPRSTGTIKAGTKKTEYLGMCPYYEMCKPDGRYPHKNLGREKRGFLAKK